MTRINPVSPAEAGILRISYADDAKKPTTMPASAASREEQLARDLDERLNNRLNTIRRSLTGGYGSSDSTSGSKDTETPRAPSPPGTGQRLDILA